LHDAAGNARHFIPIAAPMRFGRDEALPIEPYLLGCLLGDGGLTQRTLKLTTADTELREACNALLPTGTEFAPAGRYDHNLRASAPHGLLEIRQFKAQLSELGLEALGSRRKFVPTPYKLASVSQRLAMLQGLMDTDGFVGKDGHVEFSSSSDQLAHDVAFLVRSLGGTARLGYKAEPKYRFKGETRSGNPAWRVTVALPAPFNPFRLGRKADAYRGRSKYQPSRAIVKVEPVGSYPMQCIAVDSPDHLFVVDDFIVTHNTVQVVSYLLRRKLLEGPGPALVIAPTSVTHTWENEIARFAPELSTLRLHSGNERAARYEDVPNADVVITSYALARLDAQQLSSSSFRTLILDEAQNAKNPSSQIARVVRALHAEHRLALDRDAGRELAARSVGDLCLRRTGLARDGDVVPAALRDPDFRKRSQGDRRCARGSSHSCCGAPKKTWRPNCRSGPKSRSRATSRRCSAGCIAAWPKPRAATCSRWSTRRASKVRPCTCSRR
jgi:hypothetical protein